MPESTELSVTEYAVLGILAEGPSHGFAVARELGANAEVGRILTVRRPLVYRALDRLVDQRLAKPVTTEKSDSGPNRTIHRVTGHGRKHLRRWLSKPVDHVRDMRIEFLLKLAMLRRSGTSPADLVRAQKDSLQPTLAALDDPQSDDPVEIWRRHNARAAGAFLDELERMYG
ncbi:MAG: PadR family transcriptional regulator [Actinomycetota bacterium]